MLLLVIYTARPPLAGEEEVTLLLLKIARSAVHH
jgi:hypothetical protein